MDYSIEELEKWNEKIEKIATGFGLDYYPQEFEIIDYKDMLGYEAYSGMPSRYPHWSYGKAYERNKMLYSYNLTGLPYEMVINSDPCIAYLMNENTIVLQILTIAHVYGHNDFFKNNRMFIKGTDARLTVEMLKRNADTIRSYINDPSIGYEKVEKILDAAHAIRFQVSRVPGEKRISEEQIKKDIVDSYNRKVSERDIFDDKIEEELPEEFPIPIEPEEDIIYFIIKYGKLEEWEKNILQIVRNESMYFIPQIETKIMNEGWASYWHYTILNALNLEQGMHFEFIKRHNDVIRPHIGSINPYFLGFMMFKDIEKRYGREKLFEVRALERDSSFIRRYLTKDLCEEANLFQYEKKGNEYFVTDISDDTGWKEIRNNLSNSCGMSSIPTIRVKNLDKKDNCLLLEHVYDGRELQMDYARATLSYIKQLWGRNVKLATVVDNKNVTIDA
ncbi:SpoVR family protein [Clostridium oryzae]|uniref:SpoVR family protein n=1 Tax=Clostridium oryzae TaxID=1450648 RepID=A0A1V4IVC2_9CLOT|nr:SpoVR family protein [Clostridium oryzae]OPJ63367.1 SpoVR family protein [Clostridium oryzae]